MVAGYLQLILDSAVYIHQTENVTILAIHVDNVMSFGNAKSSPDDARAELHRIFKMKEEDPNWVMGFKLIEDHGEETISIDHSLYIEAVLRRFRMEECNPAHTPLDLGTLLSADDCPTTKDEKAAMKNIPYCELVGTLTWIMVVSCPDIAFVATYLM